MRAGAASAEAASIVKTNMPKKIIVSTFFILLLQKIYSYSSGTIVYAEKYDSKMPCVRFFSE